MTGQAAAVQWRRGTAADMAAFTGAAGEVAVDTTNNVVVVHDGKTAGGFPGGTLTSHPFAALPAVRLGLMIYVTNGCKLGEAAGAGTGVVAYGSAGAWRRLSDDSAVTA